MPFEGVQAALPHLPVRLEPCVELDQGPHLERVDALLALGVRAHEAGIAEHPQVLRRPRLGQAGPRHQLAYWPRRLAQQLEHRATVGIGEG